MTEEMQANIRAEMRDRLGNIDQIRDILFGSQVREYNNRLEQLEASVSGFQQEIRSRTEEMKQVISTEMHAAIGTLEKRIKSLELKEQEENKEIHQQIDRLSKRLSSNVTTLDEAIDKQVASLRDDLLTSREKLQEDVQNLRQQLFEELDKRMGSLATSKLAREDLAEMLFEVGLRLKGKEFVPELKQAVDSEDHDEDTNYLLLKGS